MTCKPSKKKRNATLKFSDEIGPEKPGGNKRKSIKKRLKKAPVRAVGLSVYHMPANFEPEKSSVVTAESMERTKTRASKESSRSHASSTTQLKSKVSTLKPPLELASNPGQPIPVRKDDAINQLKSETSSSTFSVISDQVKCKEEAGNERKKSADKIIGVETAQNTNALAEPRL